MEPIKAEQQELVGLLNSIAASSENKVFIEKYANDLASLKEPIRKDIITTARKVLRLIVKENGRAQLSAWITAYTEKIQPKFSSHLFSQSDKNVASVKEVLPLYDETSEEVDARLVLRNNFDTIFEKYPETLIFGEDSGNIGDVNQGLEGMQEKYGEFRVADVRYP